MTTIRHLASAAALVAGLHLVPAAAQAQAGAPSPDVVYHAPAWWISAVIQGKQSTLLTGDADLDRRMNVWLAGFGQGFGDRCSPSEGRALQAALQRVVADRPAMRTPAEKGTSDGKRFAEINGCSSADAAAARRTIAGLGGSLVVADNTERRDMGRREERGDMDRRDLDRREQRRDSERRDTDRRETVSQREAIVVNRSGMRIDVLQMSETSDNDWGVDRLGRDVLPSGDGVRVPLQDARSCNYDLRVLYADRRLEERMNVNLCANAQVVFDGSAARTQSQRQAPNGQPPRVNDASTRPAR
ncbi:MAG: hypothetical protein K2X43_11365 [Hyphomonadaceae bacterium]|nr:hypothetical protein [Hyphomonadaceae bacterium]